MKMPEGWKRLLSECGEPHPENENQKDFQFAFDLMKEMAEALEVLLKENDQTKINWVKYNRLLAEFKEWK